MSPPHQIAWLDLIGHSRQPELIRQKQVVISGAFTRESGREMTRQVLEMSPRPTALFAANNFIALGALSALEAAGVRVPEDLAMVTFDDLPESLVVSPFLTVAAQPVYEMAARATEMLVNTVGRQRVGKFRRDRFPHPINHPQIERHIHPVIISKGEYKMANMIAATDPNLNKG